MEHGQETPPYAQPLRTLLDELRAVVAEGPDAVCAVVDASTDRLASDADYAASMRQCVAQLFEATNSTNLLTEAGILADDGLVSGVLRRLAARVAPAPPRELPLGDVLEGMLKPGDRHLFQHVSHASAAAWVHALAGRPARWDDPSELGSALVILATRIAGAGLDTRLIERLPSLERWRSPFIELSRAADRYAESYVAAADTAAERAALRAAIARCAGQIRWFRERKKTLGTTLHLSSASLRMQQQLERLALLVECTRPEPAERSAAVARLTLELVRDRCARRPITHFVRQKIDLLSYLAVGYAAQKGDHYSARSAADFVRFFYKAALGGLLVAIFATLKIALSHEGLAPLPQALLFGINYAVCFVLIYLTGATLATKQPALTASRLAASLEDRPESESFPYLVRAIWRSQFVSFVGNIAGAALFAVLIALAYEAAFGEPLVSESEAYGLAMKNHPLQSGSVFYAAIAGVMLAASGLLAGFVDNAVIFHRLGERVQAGTGLFRWVPPRARAAVGRRLERELGDLSGNVVLGFLLGSAGMFGIIAGLPFDIRHIAFSSSHGALAMLHAPEFANVWGAARLLFAVLLIGLLNFVVSFGLTLSVAITSRRVAGADWRARARALWRLAREHPLQFFVPIKPDPPSVDLRDERGA